MQVIRSRQKWTKLYALRFRKPMHLDPRRSSFILNPVYYYYTTATTTPMACEGSIANNRTSTHAHVASAVRATRAVSPGTGTVAVPSPGNARAIAARKGRSPPCLRGAAGRSSAAINFQVICLASRSLTPGCLQAPLASSLDSVHQPCIAANSLQLMHAVGTAVLSNKIRKKTSSSKLRVLFQEIEWMVVATLIFPGKVTNDVGRDGTLHELMYPVHRFI
jgi:hypothetical protein